MPLCPTVLPVQNFLLLKEDSLKQRVLANHFLCFECADPQALLFSRSTEWSRVPHGLWIGVMQALGLPYSDLSRCAAMPCGWSGCGGGGDEKFTREIREISYFFTRITCSPSPQVCFLSLLISLCYILLLLRKKSALPR